MIRSFPDTEILRIQAEVKMEKTFTKLAGKHYSPLVIRKVTKFGFPIYVGIITDDDLSDLDKQIIGCIEGNVGLWESNNIQDVRDLAGILSDRLIKAYPKTEGVAVTFAVDKMFVASLFGDFMNHAQCKFEYYTLLNMSTNV